MPGLVNLHTHLPMTLLRGLAENVDLQGFLERVWAAEGVLMDPETVELGATLGALESLLGGCTTQLDMYFHHEATHRGAVAAGSRHVIGPVFFDGPGPDGLAWQERLDGLRAWPGILAEIGGPDVPVAAMPHATYTCAPEGLAEVVSTLRELLSTESARRGVLTTHVSENGAENADVLERYGTTPTGVLDAAGWLAPTSHSCSGTACTSARPTRSASPRPVPQSRHCPGSNLKLASGALHWEALWENGIRLGIGTDGCSSSNDLDMWQAMRQAAMLARLTSGRPDVASAEQVLRAATIEGARALGLGDVIGSLEVGKRADVVVLDLEAPHLTPVHDVAALLVFAAGRADVTDVLVDGDAGGPGATQHPGRHSRAIGPGSGARYGRPEGCRDDMSETPEQIIERLGMEQIPEEGAWFAPAHGPRASTASPCCSPTAPTASPRCTAWPSTRAGSGSPVPRWRCSGCGPAAAGCSTTSPPNAARCWSGAGRGWGPPRWATGPCWPAGAHRHSDPSTSSWASATTSPRDYPEYATEITALTRTTPVGSSR